MVVFTKRLEEGEEMNHMDICGKTIQAEAAAIEVLGQRLKGSIGAKGFLRRRVPVNDRIVLIVWGP